MEFYPLLQCYDLNLVYVFWVLVVYVLVLHKDVSYNIFVKFKTNAFNSCLKLATLTNLLLVYNYDVEAITIKSLARFLQF